jgi:peptidoglycan L-alanyl-D-glutamate endopeptidase CwlK
MPSFGTTSKKRLSSCHKDLQIIFNEVVKLYDCIILEGHRSIKRQQRLYKEGKSKIDGINKKGKHNHTPSMAVDVAPYFKDIPHVRWNDTKSFYLFAGYVIGISDILYKNNIISHKIRWGGDWDSDKDIHDQTFNDLVHFELIS